ncbi:uncharacterized protein Z520_11236 [Fonsecaea multimorphosa CBS 102226]|uniref:Transcription factor domain-containing protein n=1 Tax=Fonsecaea multimorphosa CBS 102226 TaxID=1442371 RepID=A0A0D2K9B6_9EURO|nr:uncharacterized protein Z520_11236 [Fonsecaea multimorphosa CBS 102226]KIX92963.1 hypothetical protein Z520_11236 [Fonsecaea multimorphosa CBS 102226]OAL18213.1 hypothetical protein AYO22_10791 [Fonsecaea multimorphosa]
MDSQRGALPTPGRRSLHLSRSNSNRTPDTDDDSENSRCPSPLLTIEGGYRIDPFVRYPVVRASRGVQFMADYYVQVWAPQQAQAFSVQNGGNALLELVLPLALRNSMLFQATIAMTRAAWVLRRGSDPLADKMLLRHRGIALRELRDALMAPDRPNPDLVLLTMSTLLTLNYMINDLESFEIHLRVLENMLASTEPEYDTGVKSFVRGRALAFGVLASFLQANQPSYATRINEKGHRISTLTYPGHPFLPDLCAVIAQLPEGFAEVALSGSIAVELISFLVKLTELFIWIASSQHERNAQPKPDMTMQRAIYDLQCLSALQLTPIEMQISRALLAFCLHLYNEMSFHIPLARPLRPLLETFNAHTETPRSPWLNRCLYWCSIVTASAWDTQIDASPERHVVLDNLINKLPEARSWEDTEEMMRMFLWQDRLADEWEICWRAASFRRRRQRRGASPLAVAPLWLIEGVQKSETSSSEEYL